MTELVDPDLIEKIVGVKRRKHAHIARAVSAEEKVYILHSKWCVAHNPDLTLCEYDRTLARDGIHLDLWWKYQDVPVKLLFGMRGYRPVLIPGKVVSKT